MIAVAPGTKVYLACRPVSMRYGFDGLAALAARVLEADPDHGDDLRQILTHRPVAGARLG